MLNPRLLRRRIRSVQSTAKITKAMEMMATAKMRRAQEQALSGRPYSEKISQVIADLDAEFKGGSTSRGSTSRGATSRGATSNNNAIHPLLTKREAKRIAIVYITTDRGLCGGLNANMNRMVGNFILEQNVPVIFITVGRKGRDFIIRYGRDIRADFTGLGDKPTFLDTLPISRVVIDDYTTGYVDLVYLCYPRLVSTMVQHPILSQLLPVKPLDYQTIRPLDYIYEPDPFFVLSSLLPRFVQMEVYHAILEAIASEQVARMVAMRNATENAHELIGDLTLSLNKARQEMITKELLDITGGVEALVK
ncbi:MAG: ATP synthase F1 subunit gamma [Candidatus Stahlbacteria bacterium]|nr:ATP synthase F1 subunit gamma [Candidatus Stahlbacteria bacterium]